MASKVSPSVLQSAILFDRKALVSLGQTIVTVKRREPPKTVRIIVVDIDGPLHVVKCTRPDNLPCNEGYRSSEKELH